MVREASGRKSQVHLLARCADNGVDFFCPSSDLYERPISTFTPKHWPHRYPTSLPTTTSIMHAGYPYRGMIRLD
ncbi:hypothetical protein DPMN_031959 [Dreissena polymorpha]|uniref:Uncharacterized protein n=1 Tax=Dreissena polymorpha TaxID=45954 RepID=A0A9D4M0Y5_DREPO|nr:hypothetical protein DPMN_031959 [Dreissena polymorpha]